MTVCCVFRGYSLLRHGGAVGSLVQTLGRSPVRNEHKGHVVGLCSKGGGAPECEEKQAVEAWQFRSGGVMSSTLSSDPFLPIRRVMNEYGATCTPVEFQRAVNVIFHRAESRVYDRIHRSMWKSLPQQLGLLVGDYLSAGGPVSSDSTVLDVGCGTGMATDLLLKTQIGRRISEVYLLDTSPEMLECAVSRAARWPAKTKAVNGDIESLLESGRKFEIVIISSVLHHIPDLESFFRSVRFLQPPGGILVHLQDPNGDCFGDPALERRMAALAACRQPVNLPSWLRRLNPKRIAMRLYRELTRHQNDGYIRQVNDDLIATHLIDRPMSEADLWRVTDIHVYDGHGVSMRHLEQIMVDYRLISRRAYSFFGELASELPAAFGREEQRLIAEKALNGLHMGGIWSLAK